MACHPRRCVSSATPLWEPQSSHLSFQRKKCPIFLQELFPGSKYKLVTENDVYKLIISNPKVEDTGKYTIEIAGISCTAYLDVEGKLVNLNFNFNLFCVHLIHRGYDPSDIELVNTENKVTNIIHDVRYNTINFRIQLSR
jgi:hypothetical protein